MHFCAVHLHDPCWPPGEEEVYVVVPGTSKTVIAVPLDALPQFLPLLEQVVGGDARPACPACAEQIPRLRTSADPSPTPTG